MLKLICLCLVLVAFANIPAVTIGESKDKTEFTWNDDMNMKKNSLRATIAVHFEKSKKNMEVEFKDLCEETEKNSHKGSAQKFIFKIIASQEKCPIKKGTKSTATLPYIDTYSSDDPNCGPIHVELKVYEKNAGSVPLQIFTGSFNGGVLGC